MSNWGKKVFKEPGRRLFTLHVCVCSDEQLSCREVTQIGAQGQGSQVSHAWSVFKAPPPTKDFQIGSKKQNRLSCQQMTCSLLFLPCTAWVMSFFRGICNNNGKHAFQLFFSPVCPLKGEGRLKTWGSPHFLQRSRTSKVGYGLK